MAGLFELPKSGGTMEKPRPFSQDVLDALHRDDEEAMDRGFVRARKPGEGVPVAQDLKKKEENASRESGLM